MPPTQRIAVALLVGCSSAQPPIPARYPPFSWLSVQTFIHGCQCDSVLLKEEDLAYVSKYGIAVIEKGHGVGEAGLNQGDSTIPALARQLKQRNPNQWCLFYQNPVIGFHLSNVHLVATQAEAEGDSSVYAVNRDGTPSRIFVNSTNPVGGACSTEAQNYPHGVRMLNMSSPRMREIFVDNCVNATRTGVIDGCHIDRANYAEVYAAQGAKAHQAGNTHQGLDQNWTQAQADDMGQAQQALMQELQAAVGPEMLISAKENPNVVAKYMIDWQFTNTQYFEDCWIQGYKVLRGGKNDNVTIATGHAEMAHAIAAAARGQVVMAHGCGPTEVGERLAPSCFEGDCVNEFNFTLAAFLIVAEEHSYFSYASNALDGSAMGPGAWEFRSYKRKWWPEYDRALGAPTGPGVRGWTSPKTGEYFDDVYTRSFESGTSVWVNVRTRRGIIHWKVIRSTVV